MFRIVRKKEFDRLKARDGYYKFGTMFRSLLVKNMGYFNFLSKSRSETVSSQAINLMEEYAEIVEQLNESRNDD